MEQFEYGEEVLVRNDEREDWSKRVYVGTLPNCDRHWAMSISQHPGNFDGLPWPWRQIRKIQKPEPTNKPEPIEFWVGRLQTQVMSLMDRLSKIEDELHIKSMNKPVKNIK